MLANWQVFIFDNAMKKCDAKINDNIFSKVDYIFPLRWTFPFKQAKKLRLWDVTQAEREPRELPFWGRGGDEWGSDKDAGYLHFEELRADLQKWLEGYNKCIEVGGSYFEGD